MKKSFLILVSVLLFNACTTAQPAPEENQESKWDDLIQIQEVSGSTSAAACPLLIEGQARGPWYFEASFSAKLLDQEGDLIVQTSVFADGNWMTEAFVPFHAEIAYQSDATEGVLVLENANPSGLEENAKSLEIPVQLSPCSDSEMEAYTHGFVEDYLRANIVTLSPKEAVLGGTWMVTSIEFLENERVSVKYEDGHIQEEFQAHYQLTPYGSVELDFE